MSAIDKNCTFLISTEKSTGVQQDDICKMLESTEVSTKIEGLKKAITGMLAGESMPRILMSVIRYVRYTMISNATQTQLLLASFCATSQCTN